MNPDTHFSTLAELLDLEHEAETEDNKRELDRWPVELREQMGKTVGRLVVERTDVGVGGMPLLVLSRAPAGETLSPFHAMDQGDLVRVTFLNEGSARDGTLYAVEDYRVSVAFAEDFVSVPVGKCRVDLLGSEATHKRMRRALDIAARQGGRLGELRDIFLGKRPTRVDPPAGVDWFNPGLNEDQRRAVARALAAQDVALVHGPPGTGKTTVLVEIIRQACARGRTVLAGAPSNIAVDNMLEKLLEAGLRAVRLGHPARIMDSLRHATLAAQLEEHPDYRVIRQMNEDREQMTFYRSRRRDRLSATEDMALKREIRALWKEARAMEKALSKRIIHNADVTLSTHGGIGSLLAAERFDLVCLDEASQASEPLSWVPLLHARKAVLAGDPLQLPPTIHSSEAARRGLAVTLMERLQSIVPPDGQTLLRTQYRMNEEIMGFSSERFYGGALVAHESVRRHRLVDLPGVAPTDLTQARLVFVDTAGADYHEIWNELLDSRENPGEADTALDLWARLAGAGVAPAWGAVITPYAAQARALRARVPPGLEVGTVDGFQGREKEVIVVSLVRSNDKGEVGFLSDTRRMNVAMTRARRLLIVLGDSATIGRHPFYSAFLQYVQTHGEHRSVWEWMSPSGQPVA